MLNKRVAADDGYKGPTQNRYKSKQLSPSEDVKPDVTRIDLKYFTTMDEGLVLADQCLQMFDLIKQVNFEQSSQFDVSKHDVVNKRIKSEIYLRYVKKWGVPFNKDILDMVIEAQPMNKHISNYNFVIDRVKEMLYKRVGYSLPQKKRAQIVSEIQRLNKKYQRIKDHPEAQGASSMSMNDSNIKPKTSINTKMENSNNYDKEKVSLLGMNGVEMQLSHASKKTTNVKFAKKLHKL